MRPMLADAIDIPLVFGIGIAVLVPLMAFQVFVEAGVLRTILRQPFGELCRLMFFANCWSLLAGIPTKILNAAIYGSLLPQDLPGFFARYPMALTVGSLVYFSVTMIVERIYASRWLRRNGVSAKPSTLWKGILLANVATYAVLAPLHYVLTKPTHQINEFTRDVHWTGQPDTMVIFVDSADGHLKAARLGGSQPELLVPTIVKDYLVSADLNTCAFRGADGNLYSYQRSLSQSILVWETGERFRMDQVAFSPSGTLIAFASREANSLSLFNLKTRERKSHALRPQFQKYDTPSVAWSEEETKFFVAGFESNAPLSVTVQPDLNLNFEQLSGTNGISLLPCYGRAGGGAWSGGGDWGRFYNTDSCGDLKVWTVPGLGSGLQIHRESPTKDRLLSFSVNPGLLHIAKFSFSDAAFLKDCNECLFEANGYIYLLDIQKKRVGTVAHGERFVLLTERYRKQLSP